MNKIHYTYGGVSRHEFLIGITDTVVNEFYGKPKKEDGQPFDRAMDAWQEIYVSLMEILNDRDDLHDQERPSKDDPVHYGAKRILLAEARAIRGRMEADQKTDAHEEVNNSRVKDLLIHAQTGTTEEDDLVEQAFLELDAGYREILTAVVLEDKENTWPRYKLSRALTSLGNKIDLKFSKHLLPIYATQEDGEEVLIEPTPDPTELTIDEIIEQYDHEEVHVNWSEVSHHDALEDLLGREFPRGFEDAVAETISSGYGIDFHLYTLCNNQGTSDPKLMRAWNHLTNDEKELLLIRYNRGYDSRFKRRYHEESCLVRDKLEKIWIDVEAYEFSLTLEVIVSGDTLEGTFKAPVVDSEPLLEPEPVQVPQSVQEALPIVSSGFDSLEAYLVDGFVDDPRFDVVWSQLDELDRFYLQFSADPGVPELTKRRARPKIEAATDRYMILYAGV